MRILHAGCGHSPLPGWLGFLKETRLDIDPGVSPDIVAPITELGLIGPFNAVYCSHTLEHLYPHQVAQALAEFRRVLVPGGVCIIVVPDLEGIQPTTEIVYVSPSGPITGRDMYYGKADLLEENPYMAHKTGFLPATLQAAMEEAGFAVTYCEGKNRHNIMALGKA